MQEINWYTKMYVNDDTMTLKVHNNIYILYFKASMESIIMYSMYMDEAVSYLSTEFSVENNFLVKNIIIVYFHKKIDFCYLC